MWMGQSQDGPEKALAKHRELYKTETRPVDWDAYIASYPAPWEPCYYQAGLDDEPGSECSVEVRDGSFLQSRVYVVQAPRRVGKGAPQPLGSLVVSTEGLALDVIDPRFI